MNVTDIIHNVLLFSESIDVANKYNFINKQWYNIINNSNFWKLKFNGEKYDDTIFNKRYYIPYFMKYEECTIKYNEDKFSRLFV